MIRPAHFVSRAVGLSKHLIIYLHEPASRASHGWDGDDTGPETCGVASATRTASPFVNVSGGLLMLRSDVDNPAKSSTLSPRSRPSCTFLRTTTLWPSRVAT